MQQEKKSYLFTCTLKNKKQFFSLVQSLWFSLVWDLPLSGVSLSNRGEAALPMSICCVPEPHLGPACEHLSFSLFHLQCLSAGCSLIPVNISGPPTTDDLVLPWPS